MSKKLLAAAVAALALTAAAPALAETGVAVPPGGKGHVGDVACMENGVYHNIPVVFVAPPHPGKCHGAVATAAIVAAAKSGGHDEVAYRKVRHYLGNDLWGITPTGSGWLFMNPDPRYPSNLCGVAGGWVPYAIVGGVMYIAPWAKDCVKVGWVDTPTGRTFYAVDPLRRATA